MNPTRSYFHIDTHMAQNDVDYNISLLLPSDLHTIINAFKFEFSRYMGKHVFFSNLYSESNDHTKTPT